MKHVVNETNNTNEHSPENMKTYLNIDICGFQEI